MQLFDQLGDIACRSQISDRSEALSTLRAAIGARGTNARYFA